MMRNDRGRLVNLRGYHSEHGGSYVFGDCSHCGFTSIKAFIWSISGGGKKCPKCNFILSLGDRVELHEAVDEARRLSS